MKTRITLTVDSALTHRARTLARSRGTSLSRVVEDLLSEACGEGGRTKSKKSFSSRWAGRMELAEKTGEPRYWKLKEKYGLEAEA